MYTALFLAPFVVLPLALLGAAVWVCEAKLRPNAIAPSRRLLVYASACLLAAVGPAWLMGETYGVILRDRPDMPGPYETWGMLTLGLTSFGTLAMAIFDRARSVWLYRRWARKHDPYAAKAGGGPEEGWWDR
ncbi:MAG: hypothetical protein ACOZNI_08960 [Myxococcota bacterium]